MTVGNSTVIIIEWLTVTKYSFLKWQWFFYNGTIYIFTGKVRDNFPQWVYSFISIKGLRSTISEPCLLSHIPEGTIGNAYILICSVVLRWFYKETRLNRTTLKPALVLRIDKCLVNADEINKDFVHWNFM